MWNGPIGKVLFTRPDLTLDGAVICPAFVGGHVTASHDEVPQYRSPNQNPALGSALSQTV